MKKTHYSRAGYNGDFTYTSVCGKQVRTHQENEDSTIYPHGANCKECMNTKEYNADKNAFESLGPIYNRIYIESDFLKRSEFITAQMRVRIVLDEQGLPCVDRVFSRVVEFAWHDLDKTWGHVVLADEIYASTSLMPLVGGSYTGAPVIFNGMCERAVKEGIEDKKVFILNSLENIEWDMIDINIMRKAFKNNHLLTYEWESNKFVKVDIDSIKYN